MEVLTEMIRRTPKVNEKIELPRLIALIENKPQLKQRYSQECEMLQECILKEKENSQFREKEDLKAQYETEDKKIGLSKFRDISVAPNEQDLNDLSMKKLLPNNPVEGGFSCLNHYLGTHFYLLREVFVLY